MMGKVILVASGKGGTGKTMFSVNMGAALAQQGCSVMLLDMDMGLRNMDVYLGMENRVVYNIMDVLSGICRISKATIKVDGFETLYFMAAAPRKRARMRRACRSFSSASPSPAACPAMLPRRLRVPSMRAASSVTRSLTLSAQSPITRG